MHIVCVYLSTYSQDKPITGHFDMTDGKTKTQIDFDENEAAAIQAICVAALDRKRNDMIKALVSADIAVPQLTAPTNPNIEDADFTEVPF